MKQFLGYQNNPTKETLEKIGIFKKYGVDFVKVSNLALQKLNENFSENKEFIKVILSTKEESSKMISISLFFQYYWKAALNELYPSLIFEICGQNSEDIVCKNIPELSHELKNSIALGVNLENKKYYYKEDKYYKPSLSSHLSNKKQASKNKKKCKSNVFVHIKIYTPTAFGEKFNLIYVQALYLRPGDLTKHSSKGYLSNKKLKEQSIMLYEDTSYIQVAINLAKNKNIEIGVDPDSRHESAYTNRRKEWNNLTIEEKLKLSTTNPSLYTYARLWGWLKEIEKYKEEFKNNKIKSNTEELVHYIKNNGFKGLSKNKKLYQYMRYRIYTNNMNWNKAEKKYIELHIGTRKEQLLKYGGNSLL